MSVLLSNRLARPTGKAAGFDPSHPLSRYATFSGIARNGFGSVRSGVSGTITGSPTNGISNLGQIVNLTGTAKFTWAGYPTFVTGISTPSAGTIAAIFSFSTNNAANYVAGTTATPGTSGFALSCGTSVTFGDWSQNIITATATLTAGVPYFVLASFFYTGNANGDGNQTICIVNLSTGKVVVEATTTTFFFLANAGGTYSVGPVTGAAKVAATMLAKSYISPEMAAVIAADPWSFWYPGLPRTQGQSTVNAYTLAAGAGTYALSGTAASLLHTYLLPAAGGAYALAGTAATLRRNLPLVAGVGTYALTGANVSLLHKYVLPAAVGTYALTGTAATLKHGYAVAAGSGTYVLNGVAATLRKTWLLPAGVGTYVLAGADATLTHLSGKTVVAGVGTYALAGAGASLLHTYLLPAGAGSYTLSGVAAALKHGYVVSVGAGSYTISGSAAALRKTWLLSGGTGSYVLSGSAATLTHGGVAGLSSSGVRRLRSAHEADDKEAYYREVRRREALQVQQIRLAELQQQQQEIEAKQALDVAQIRRPKAKVALAGDGFEARIASLRGELAALNGAIIDTRAEIARLDDIEMQEALAASMREDDETILILAASI